MNTQILHPTPENIRRVADAIAQDAVVGMPTETVYGLAGNGRSSLALARIFETKERPTFDPLILHIGPLKKGIESLDALNLIRTEALSALQIQQIETLIHRFWPGPLTLVLPKHASIPDLATSDLPSVALRMPAHPVAQALIAAAGTPLAAPSANRFGRISPTTALAVEQELGGRIPYILNGGPCPIGLESTIIGFASTDEPGETAIQVLRPGGTPIEAIEHALGITLRLPTAHPQTPSATQALLAPGMLESHYAPRTPLVVLPNSIPALRTEDGEKWKAAALPGQLNPSRKVGLLLMQGDPAASARVFSALLGHPVECLSLSESGDLTEAAQRFFSSLRELDSLGLAAIFAEPCLHREGLGYAISDRLQRASAPRSLEFSQ